MVNGPIRGQTVVPGGNAGGLKEDLSLLYGEYREMRNTRKLHFYFQICTSCKKIFLYNHDNMLENSFRQKIHFSSLGKLVNSKWRIFEQKMLFFALFA